MEQSVGFLSPLLRLEEVWFVKKLRIDLRLLDKIRDLNRVGRFDLDLLKVLFT